MGKSIYKDPATELESPVKINLIAKFCNVGFGDQLLAIFTQIKFAENLCKEFPKYFTMDNFNLLHDYGELRYIEGGIQDKPDSVAEEFYPWRENKLINKPPRLYQCDIFKPLSGIKHVRTNCYPVHFNIITSNQSHIPLFTNKPGKVFVEDPYLIAKIVLMYKQTNRPIWISLDYRILGTFAERVEFAKDYLQNPTVPLDDFTKTTLNRIDNILEMKGGAGCVHIRLTDCTLIQKHDADMTKNGKEVETCLGRQEPKTYFKNKINKWVRDFKEKYKDKPKVIYVFSDDIPEAKRLYKSCFDQMHPIEVIFVDRPMRERFTESWKDYLIMRECNEHVGSISMFGMWARSYHDYFSEIHTNDRMAFPEHVVYEK